MFYEGKLKLFQLRLLYDNISRRPIENILMLSGITEIATDSDDQYAEMIYKVAKVLLQFKFEIDTNALPSEKKYFTERGYKADELRRDLKIHLRAYPNNKSIETELDYKGFSGSNLFRFIINRIMFRPIKDETLVISAREIINEADQIIYHSGVEIDNIDSEIRELSRELNYRRKLVTDVLNSKMNDISHIEQSKSKLKEDLQRELSQVDSDLYNSLEKFDRVVKKKLSEERNVVLDIIKNFNQSQSEKLGVLDGLRKEIDAELLGLVETVKSLKPFDNFEITKVRSRIQHVKELLTFALADRETFSAMAEEFNQLSDMIKNLSTLFENSSYKGANIQKTSQYLSILNDALSKQVENYEKVFNNLDSNLKVAASQLGLHLKNIEKTVVEGSSAVSLQTKKISTVLQNLS